MISEELNWLEEVITDRLELLQKSGGDWRQNDTYEISPSALSDSVYAEFVRKQELSADERLLAILALAPQTAPWIFNPLIEFGKSDNALSLFYGGTPTDEVFIPSGETALFLLAGTDFVKRMEKINSLGFKNPEGNKQLFHLEKTVHGKSFLSGKIIASEELLLQVHGGKRAAPSFGTDFPAKYISTGMDWDDLVLAPVTRTQVEEVKVWMKHRTRLLDELGMRKRIHPGYKILFYGPPGTGKTLTAVLLGKFTGKDVFRIDLSSVVSKYIGETEKNLAKVFDKAMHSDWILFFDEADALFGARTKVSSSHDRYANQEVSYLLQRIEDFPGIVILATNMKNNIDDAFARRFQSMVYFPFPKAEERFNLWQKAFPSQLKMNVDIDFRKIAAKFELTGGQITNVVAWCSLMALEKGDDTVTEASLRDGVARELAKEGRTL